MAAVERRVVLTGAASWVGAALTKRLAGPGTALALDTRANRAGLEAVADRVRAAGAEIGLARGDLVELATAARALARGPLERLGRPDEIAATIAFPPGPEAGYITGQAIRVDGRLRL